MIYPVYAVRDALNGFGQLMLDTNDQTAIRNFKTGLSGNSSMLASVKDYDLYKLAEYDTEKGTVVAVVPIELVISGPEAVGGM